MEVLLFAVVTLGGIGLVSAIVLFIASKKFAVYSDPRIAKVAEVLPQANCGGCGYPGCSGFAEACVKAGSLEGKLCPVGGQPVMAKVADILGLAAVESEPKVAVVRCNGTCANRPKLSRYDGVKSCAIAAATYGGETGIAEVDESKCTACGACVKACPKGIIELRNKGKNNRRVYVSCVNKDKGIIAKKACAASCIGCGKCVKTCPFGAITLENNLAYIDFNICKMCRKCVDECPQGAIQAINFPPRKPKAEPAADATVKPEVKAEPVAVKAETKTEAAAEGAKTVGEQTK